ncbi:hypothetical protein I352_06623 [Cryptococcus deuterogattii MMRL2647]|nr:hypothetical protein I352_06623 [Cryptococcus deuterogattii MMRL2647]
MSVPRKQSHPVAPPSVFREGPGQSEQVRKLINTHTPEPHLPLLSTAPRRRQHTGGTDSASQ